MKAVFLFILASMLTPAFASAQSIDFGNDASEWSKDGECDDRRFRGSAMASGLDRDDVGKDATDCRRGIEMGQLKVWDFVKARRETQCDAIKFGNDSSEWSGDCQCDDYRFDGPGADYVLLKEDVGKDATDCQDLCAAGKIAVREY